MAWRPRSSWLSAAPAPQARAARRSGTASPTRTRRLLRLAFAGPPTLVRTVDRTRLHRQHDAVMAGIGASIEAVRMDPEGMHGGKAVRAGAADDLVSLCRQLPLDTARDPIRHVDGIAGSGEARRAHRLHHGHVEVNGIQEHLEDAHGAPITMCGRSPSNTMDGTTELKRALPGARLPARPGRGSNTPMQPLYMKPRPSVTTPEGIPSECVMVTQLPSPSNTDTCVVSLLGEPPALKRGTSTFFPTRISSASLTAYALLVSSPTGTSTKRGSPTWRSLSTVARFIASATTRMYSAELCSSLPRAKRSRMFSISMSITPPPGGWLLETR